MKSLDDRLYTALATAEIARQNRRGDVIQIHLGQDVHDYLTKFVEKVDVPTWARPASTLFGFPVVLDAGAKPDSIHVHIISIIR